jgi:general secretion pathway protein B
MSSILDALKKSEADRQRAAGPTLLDLHVQPRKRGLPAWAIALGVLLVGNVALLSWLTMRHSPAAGTGAQVAGAGQPAAAAAPAAAAPPSSAPAAPLPAAAPAAPATALQGGARLPAGADDGDNPADEAPAVEAPRRPRAAGGQGALQSYSALSATLPPLHLDLHFWSDSPAERYALINLHRVGEGDALPEGPRVLEITRDGVVMEYQGREFVLGRE